MKKPIQGYHLSKVLKRIKEQSKGGEFAFEPVPISKNKKNLMFSHSGEDNDVLDNMNKRYPSLLIKSSNRLAS